MPEIRQSTRGAIVIDDRYTPLIITTFFGETDLALGRWFEDVHKKLLLSHGAQGRRILSIADATMAVKPTPDMRRFWAELSDRSTPTMKEATLATFLVVNSALIRGAITAISWMSPSLRDLESFGTVDEAIREAFQRLARAGTPIVKLSVPYQLPELAHKARAAFAG
jgi:hypothetical protein